MNKAKTTLNTLIFLFLFSFSLHAQTPPPTHTQHTIHFTPSEQQKPVTPPTSHSVTTPYDSSLPNEPMPPQLRSPDADNDQFYSQFLNMLSTLGIVIAVILFITWVMKQLLNNRIQQINSSSAIKVLERRSITPKTAIYLLDINGKGIAVAESQNGITKLSDFVISESNLITPTAVLTDQNKS